MVALGSIVNLDEARAIRRKTPDSHAPSNPQFIVQHTSRGHRHVASNQSGGKSINGVDYTDADGDAPFVLRDRLNALAVHFGLAATQPLMSNLMEASARGDAEWYEELVAEFDAAYTEATASR